MPMLSEDDMDIRDLSAEELDLAWDLWFDLAQTTNDDDPPYSHGVFQFVQFSTHPASALGHPEGPDAQVGECAAPLRRP